MLPREEPRRKLAFRGVVVMPIAFFFGQSKNNQPDPPTVHPTLIEIHPHPSLYSTLTSPCAPRRPSLRRLLLASSRVLSNLLPLCCLPHPFVTKRLCFSPSLPSANRRSEKTEYLFSGLTKNKPRPFLSSWPTRMPTRRTRTSWLRETCLWTFYPPTQPPADPGRPRS